MWISQWCKLQRLSCNLTSLVLSRPICSVGLEVRIGTLALPSGVRIIPRTLVGTSNSVGASVSCMDMARALANSSPSSLSPVTIFCIYLDAGLELVGIFSVS